MAEAQYEFEHRDLHWYSTVVFELTMVMIVMSMTADLERCISFRGNVLLGRNDSVTLQFTLEGKKMFVKTFGLLISIIDFTLSRINTGIFFSLSLH